MLSPTLVPLLTTNLTDRLIPVKIRPLLINNDEYFEAGSINKMTSNNITIFTFVRPLF